MADPPPDGVADDFFEQILSMPGYGSLAGGEGSLAGMVLQLSSGDSSAAVGGFSGTAFPLGLSLEQGNGGGAGCPEEGSGSRSAPAKEERDPVQQTSLFPAFEHLRDHQIRPNPTQAFHGQATRCAIPAAPQPPAPRPRLRARRGQATDPHSIAERLRRERITERMRALQELVPNFNKTDRAAMLDEIVDYVKFLRLQVKVLSMSRLGGAGAVAQLVADIPLQSVEGEAGEDGGSKQQVWDKWSNDGTERRVAKLMEEDIGAAMQFLQSKSLCIMPISLATTIYHSHRQPEPSLVKPEPDAPS